MAEREQGHEIVARFDYSGESIVLTESDDGDLVPGAHPGEARVEVDPLVEAFARSPYDPVIGAMMMGRATGEVIARPPRIGWMRVLAYVLAIGLLAQPAALVYFERTGGNLVSANLLSSAGLSLAFGLAGLLLLRRLLRG